MTENIETKSGTQRFGEPLLVTPNPRLVRDEVVDRLREAIKLGRLAPGQRLKERELCERTGVSRTSVREALRQLESEGLVTHIPRKGPAVASISVDEAAAIYDVRKVLEPRMVALFVENASDGEADELRRAMDQLESVAGSGDMERLSDAKARYFEILMRGCRNGTLEDFVRNLHLRLALIRSSYLAHMDRWPDSVRELRAVTDAVTERDADTAVKMCLVHLDHATTAALERLAESTNTGASHPAS